MLMDSLAIEVPFFNRLLFIGISTLPFILWSSFLKVKVLVYNFLSRLSLVQKEILLYAVLISIILYFGFDSTNNYFYWLGERISGNFVTRTNAYESATKYLGLILSSLTINIFLIRKNTKLLLLIYSFFIFQWHLYVESAYGNALIYTLGIMMYFISSNNERVKDAAGSMHLGSYGPILAGVIALNGLMIPFSLPVIELEGVSRELTDRFPVLESMRSTLEDSMGGSEFRFSSMPYQPSTKRLGGSVELSNQKLFYVHADSPKYLRGIIKEVYTGENWEKGDIQRYFMRDNRFDIKPETLGYESSKVTIYPTYINTRTIFHPYFTYEFEGFNDKLIYDDSIQVEKDSGSGNQKTSYTLHTFEPSFVWEREYTSDEIIYIEPYLQLPDSVTERTVELAHQITDGVTGINEKLKAIEGYLKSTYPYTLETTEVPQGHDFVDYFLFEEQKGYCTYYASAMAVMGRSLGIATRYVEGFRMNSEKDETGAYVVREDRAHAWVEAFVPGSGWLTFEPTGSSLGESSNGEESQDSFYLNQGVLDDEVYMDIQYEAEEQGEDILISNIEDGGGNIDSDTKTKNRFFIFIIAGLFAGILIASLRYKNIKMKLRLLEEDKTRRGLLLKYKEAMELFYEIRPDLKNMSPMGKMNNINHHYSLSEYNLGEYINKIAYSQKPIDEDEAELMNSIFQKSLEEYKKYKGKWVYYTKVYIKGIGN